MLQWREQIVQVAGRILGSCLSHAGEMRRFAPRGHQSHLPFANAPVERQQPIGRDLSPTLVRWQIDMGAPAHLSVSVDEVAHASPETTVLVIPDGDDPGLLERVTDAHRRGARVMTIERVGSNLAECSHELLTVGLRRSERDYDSCQHIVSLVAPGH